MFIGHFGVALAAKKIAPRVSLGTLIFAAQFLDLLWPMFLLLGWEHVRIAPGITKVSPFEFFDYPISHSLLAAVGWSIAVATGDFSFRRNRRAALVLGLAVLSHWILDFLTHRPDLPGYVSITQAREKIGRYGFWSFMIFLVIAWIASLAAGAPPSTTALAWSALSIWITVLWGWWADSHRRVSPRA
jgi:hypothetical protein